MFGATTVHDIMYTYGWSIIWPLMIILYYFWQVDTCIHEKQSNPCLYKYIQEEQLPTNKIHTNKRRCHFTVFPAKETTKNIFLVICWHSRHGSRHHVDCGAERFFRCKSTSGTHKWLGVEDVATWNVCRICMGISVNGIGWSRVSGMLNNFGILTAPRNKSLKNQPPFVKLLFWAGIAFGKIASLPWFSLFF